MDDISSELYRFTELPEAIRFRIWTYAAYVPRVVELHEHLSKLNLPERTSLIGLIYELRYCFGSFLPWKQIALETIQPHP